MEECCSEFQRLGGTTPHQDTVLSFLFVIHLHIQIYSLTDNSTALIGYTSTNISTVLLLLSLTPQMTIQLPLPPTGQHFNSFQCLHLNRHFKPFHVSGFHL